MNEFRLLEPRGAAGEHGITDCTGKRFLDPQDKQAVRMAELLSHAKVRGGTADILPAGVLSAKALAGCPALVLNADYRPLSYYPLSLWPWQEVVKSVFLERVDVIAEYEHCVHSPSFTMKLPSVIALREFVRQDRPPAFTRFNVFLRDGFKCVYCHATEDLTFDHVIPRSRGGRTSWDNIVAACSPCNLRKGGRMPHDARMHPQIRPARPSTYQLQDIGRKFPPNHLHETWLDYLYWDVELEG